LETENKKNFLINFCYITVASAIIFIAFKFLIGYFLPFIIAIFIAFIMQTPADFLSRKIKIKKGIAAATLSVVAYLVAAVLTVFVFYKLITSLSSFTERLPELLNEITVFSETIKNKFSDLMPKDYSSFLDNFWKSTVESVTQKISNLVSKTLTRLAKSTPSFLFGSIVALVATCYIAKDYNILVKFTKELCGKRLTDNIKKIKGIMFESVFKLFKGYLILTFFTFLQLFLGFTVLRLKNAFLLAILISLVDILPVLGTGTVLIPWAFFSIISNNISLGIGLAVLYVIVIFARNFAEPKIIGTQIGINPLFTLIAMFAGLKLLGIWGLFLFPVTLIVVVKYYKNQMQEGLSV